MRRPCLPSCAPCESGVVHFRVVFRYLNAVHVLYVYGLDQFVYRDVVIKFDGKDLLQEAGHSIPVQHQFVHLSLPSVRSVPS